jgi:hypothetical protein
MLSCVIEKTLLELTNVLEGIEELLLHLLHGRLALGLLERTRLCKQASNSQENLEKNPASIAPSLTGWAAVSNTSLPTASLVLVFAT